MSRAKLLAALSVVFLLGALTPYLARTAEEKLREVPALKLAYVDMGKLFTECQSYKNAIEGMKAQTVELETKFKSDYEDMKNLAEVLKGFPPESDDYKRTESELGKKELDFKFRQAEARKKFETRINDVQFKLFQEIEQISRKLCAQYGVGMLIRTNTAPVDGKDPQQVLRAINQSIIVADPRLDLTGEILLELSNLPPLELP